MLETLIQIIPILLTISFFVLIFWLFILACQKSKRQPPRVYPSVRPRLPYGPPEKRRIEYSPVTPGSQQYQKKPARPKAEVKRPIAPAPQAEVKKPESTIEPIQYSPVTPGSQQHQKEPAKPKAEVKKPIAPPPKTEAKKPEPPISPSCPQGVAPQHPVEISTSSQPAAPLPQTRKPSIPIPDSINSSRLRELATKKPTIAVNRGAPYKVLLLLHGDRKAADRLFAQVSFMNPGKSEKWCWDKVQWDIERDRL
ncbi:hypothetical protein ACKFKF_30785 [Phormidesmis sp. 146-12]